MNKQLTDGLKDLGSAVRGLLGGADDGSAEGRSTLLEHFALREALEGQEGACDAMSKELDVLRGIQAINLDEVPRRSRDSARLAAEADLVAAKEEEDNAASAEQQGVLGSYHPPVAPELKSDKTRPKSHSRRPNEEQYIP